jgi:hypothetical protein
MTKIEEVTAAKPPEPATQEFVEFGIRYEDARPYLTVRSFLLTIKAGPVQPIPKGVTVWLSKKTGEELFYANKVEPLHLGKFFKAVRDFTTVEQGEWVLIHRDDVLELDRAEAIELLRQGKVHELSESEVKDETEGNS